MSIALTGTGSELTLRVAGDDERAISGSGTATLFGLPAPAHAANRPIQIMAAWRFDRWSSDGAGRESYFGIRAWADPGGHAAAIEDSDVLVFQATRRAIQQSLGAPSEAPLWISGRIRDDRFDALWTTILTPGLLTPQLGYRFETPIVLTLPAQHFTPRGDLTPFEDWLDRGEPLVETAPIALELFQRKRG